MIRLTEKSQNYLCVANQPDSENLGMYWVSIKIISYQTPVETWAFRLETLLSAALYWIQAVKTQLKTVT